MKFITVKKYANESVCFQDCDYRSDEAITFWRENFDKIQVQQCVKIIDFLARRHE